MIFKLKGFGAWALVPGLWAAWALGCPGFGMPGLRAAWAWAAWALGCLGFGLPGLWPALAWPVRALAND